mmetsp:Transcript_28085/g.62200  ORF Transcript_28085/g.62200 Transcript_28085/m.62200 type:complete len:299 (+) Transcript_28085:62-958(+)
MSRAGATLAVRWLQQRRFCLGQTPLGTCAAHLSLFSPSLPGTTRGRLCGSAGGSTDRLRPPRSDDFYEQKQFDRHYYYVMDLRGQLFLESTGRRNIATCLKDPKFLDMTLRNMRPNDTAYEPEIPFVSLCGREINFITPEDPTAALGFRALQVGATSSGSSGDCGHISSGDSGGSGGSGSDLSATAHLLYGGSLREPFDPSRLAMSLSNGRIYHYISAHRNLRGRLGLLHPHTSQELSRCLREVGPPAGEAGAGEAGTGEADRRGGEADLSAYAGAASGGVHVELAWGGQQYRVAVVD